MRYRGAVTVREDNPPPTPDLPELRLVLPGSVGEALLSCLKFPSQLSDNQAGLVIVTNDHRCVLVIDLRTRDAPDGEDFPLEGLVLVVGGQSSNAARRPRPRRSAATYWAAGSPGSAADTAARPLPWPHRW